MIDELQYNFYKLYSNAVKLGWTRENIADFLQITSDTVRRKIIKIERTFGLTLPKIPLRGDSFTEEMRLEMNQTLGDCEVPKHKEKKIYVITSAQNATPVHQPFLKAILNYCDNRNAELLVIPYRYKNPTSLWTETQETDDWWASNVEDYLLSTKKKLSENLIIMGDIKIQPTASDPISGFEGFSGSDSVILGHPKIRLESIPTLGEPKLLLTTGSITIPNYTDSKAGQKAKFHHSLAAVVVEVDTDGIFFIRHINATENGSFYDLDTLYTPTEIVHGIRVEALITGDSHAMFMDENVENATYHDPNSIVSLLKPKKVVLHDVLDFYSRNHHHRGNDVIAYGKHHFGRNNVQEELQITADFIDRISKPNQEVVVVRSNHDAALDRYLKEYEPKSDAENARLYYYLKYHQMKNVQKTDTGFSTFDAFEFWCKNPESGAGLRNQKTTRFLKRGESLKIGKFELGLHGDIGPNGSRGSAKGLSKMCEKLVIGHSHSPSIYESVYQVGLSCKKNLEYASKPSSWVNSHAILYSNNKITLIHVINGKWKI